MTVLVSLLLAFSAGCAGQADCPWELVFIDGPTLILSAQDPATDWGERFSAPFYMEALPPDSPCANGWYTPPVPPRWDPTARRWGMVVSPPFPCFGWGLAVAFDLPGGPAIFADGFETGNVSRWSAVKP